MPIKKLKKILEEFDCSSAEELSYEDKELKIRVKKKGGISEQSEEQERKNCILCPLVGVYYEANPAVREGQMIEKGSTLCIIESMKMMNRICAPYDLIINKKLFRKGERVEYDNVLFEVDSYDQENVNCK